MAPQYPTLDRIKEVRKESQTIADFLDWLVGEGYVICVRADSEVTPWVPSHSSTEQLLAGYFDIDLSAAERERQQILSTLGD